MGLSYYLAENTYKPGPWRRDLDLAFFYVGQAVANEHNIPEAEFYLSRMYAKGHGVSKSCAKSNYWLESAKKKKVPIALKLTQSACGPQSPNTKTE